MKEQFERFLLSPAYPLLFSVYPILTLFAANIYQISYIVFFRPFLVSFLVGILLLGIMKLLFSEWHKAAFFATMGILFLATYGHVENFLVNKEVQNATAYILIAWLIFILFFVLLNKKYKDKFNYVSLAPAMNLMAVILLIFPIGKIIQYTIAQNTASSIQEKDYENLDMSSIESPPDIYYIILDGYGRSDVLKEMYDFDNSEFVGALEEIGFYVADCSQSNYPKTVLSLTSTLNLNYIPDLNQKFTPDEIELLYLFELLENNALSNILDAAGYTIVSFASGFPWAEMKSSDIYISPEAGPINEFEIIYLQTTFARFFDDLGLVDFEDLSAERFRERTRLVFNSFEEISKISEPTFTFVHLIAPHAPFGFDAEGNAISPKNVNSEEGYVNQATYAGDEILKNVQVIIKNSKRPPIIIVQGDHGPWTARPDWHLGILNAYYLPGKEELLYPKITPVNTFRLVLNEYFGANYDMLPDQSFDVKMPYMYDFTFIENTCEK